jgi:hypothetical protein
MASLIPSANASGTGSMTLAGPSTNSNQTVNIPDTTGTMMVNGPTFSILGTAGVGFTSSTATKVPYGSSTQWDTASCYSTANHRFTPNVAGYYQVNANAAIDVTAGTVGLCWVYKNGTLFKRGNQISLSAGAFSFATIETTVSAIVYCNGTTDYLEIYAYCAGTSPTFNGDRWFDACLIRSA